MKRHHAISTHLITLISLLVVLTLLLAACGGAAPATPAPIETAVPQSEAPTAVPQPANPDTAPTAVPQPANPDNTPTVVPQPASPDNTPTANAPTASSGTPGMVADLGFRPEVQGFGFENYGSDKPYQNLTTEDMQRLFGDPVCASKADGKCILAPQVQEIMDQWNKSMGGGHCFGMSAAALRFYINSLNPADFGGSTVADLKMDGNEKLQREIAFNFVFQFLNPVNNGKITGTPNEVLDKLIELLKPGARAPEVYTVAIFKADGTGGHAITPYAVEDRGNGQFAILVYDNNWPKTPREILVDRNANTWTYYASINPGVPAAEYKGDATTKSLSLYPTTPGLKVKQGMVPCTYCLAHRTAGVAAPAIELNEIYLDGNPENHAHLLITDEQGHRYGYLSDGSFVTEIPGIKIERVMSGETNWLDTEEPIYHVPTNLKFSLTIDGTSLKQAGETSVVMVGPGYDIGVESLKLEPGQKDTLTLAPDGSHLIYKTDGTESPDIVLGIEHQGADYSFLVKGMDLVGGGSVDVSLDYDKGVLKLDTSGNKGTATYSLVMNKIVDSGEIVFGHDGIQLDPADVAYLEFGKWAGNGSPLQLGIDRGGTGSISETLDLTDIQ